MPFTSSSYFGSVRQIDRIVGQNAGLNQTGQRVFLAGLNAGRNSTVSDLVVVGSSALSAVAGVTDANARYSTVLGSSSAIVATDFTEPVVRNFPGPIVVVGGNILPALARMPSTVAIGANIAPSLAGAPTWGANVIIGIDAMRNVDTSSNYEYNVIIGYGAQRKVVSAGQSRNVTQSVVIGALACANGAAFELSSANVVIGTEAGLNMDRSEGNVLIGYRAGWSITTSPSQGRNTIIGSGADCSSAGERNVIVGFGSIVANNTQYATLLGSEIVANNNDFSGCIVIGAGANANVSMQDKFLMETDRGGTRRALMYGDNTRGSLVVGHSTNGTNRDFPGTNLLKLLNGTITGVAPAGGGFFYVNAGELHWVGSANTDTVIAPA